MHKSSRSLLWLVVMTLGLLMPAASEPKSTQLTIIDIAALLTDERAASRQSQLLSAVLQQLPMQVEMQEMNWSRAMLWVEGSETSCMPWLIKTPERAERFLFSDPYMLEDALSLALKKDSPLAQQLQRQLTPQTAISLATLLQQPRAPVLGIESNRSYGTHIDALLVKLQHSSSVYTRTSVSEQPAELIPMLKRGFIDMILEYPSVISNQHPDLMLLPLQETEPFQLSHFACSNTLAMQPVMDQLNTVIRRLSQDPTYQQLVLQPLADDKRAAALLYWHGQLKEAEQ